MAASAERALAMVLHVLVVRCGTVGGDASGNGARRSLTLEQHRGAAQPPGKVLSTAGGPPERQGDGRRWKLTGCPHRRLQLLRSANVE
jgi:hypothetical protein